MAPEHRHKNEASQDSGANRDPGSAPVVIEYAGFQVAVVLNEDARRYHIAYRMGLVLHERWKVDITMLVALAMRIEVLFQAQHVKVFHWALIELLVNFNRWHETLSQILLYSSRRHNTLRNQFYHSAVAKLAANTARLIEWNVLLNAQLRAEFKIRHGEPIKKV